MFTTKNFFATWGYAPENLKNGEIWHLRDDFHCPEGQSVQKIKRWTPGLALLASSMGLDCWFLIARNGGNALLRNEGDAARVIHPSAMRATRAQRETVDDSSALCAQVLWAQPARNL